MNHEIIKVLTAKEYLEVFLNKNLRIDRRDLKEKRPISYNFGILDSFSTSASCSIGENNKIIAVLKSSNNTEEGDNKIGTH
jgi:exosome complex RNA-binding protein Rrp42 (RNase PH superfamily)